MQVTKTKVNYTETEIQIPAAEVRELIAAHVSSVKNVSVNPDEIKFEVSCPDSMTDEPATLLSVYIRALKRGRAVANGRNGHAATPARSRRKKEEEPEEVEEETQEQEEEEEVEEKPRRGKKGKKRRQAEEDDE